MTDNKKGDIINFTSMKEDKTFDMELASVTNIRPLVMKIIMVHL